MKRIKQCDTKDMIDFQISHNISRVKKTQSKYRKKARTRHIKFIKKHVSDVKSILCMGCRNKSELDDFRRAGFKVIGIDILPSKHYLVMDAHEIEQHFKHDQFDFVYASHFLEHLYDPAKVLSGIRNISKYGIFIVLPTCHKGVTNFEKKSKPSMSHPVIYDIMSKTAENVDGITKGDLEDFQILEPYNIRHYKLNRRGEKNAQDECEIALEWSNL